MKHGRKLKNLMITALAAALATGILASCGANKTQNDVTPSSTSEPNKSESDLDTNDNTETNTFNPKGSDQSSSVVPSQVPQTAEEAANDTEAITNEIESLAQLIADGNFDDAMMQIRALLTKNLSDADRETIENYRRQIEDKISNGLSQ